MEFIRIFCIIYCISSAIACLVHMWRYRKQKEYVKIYGMTFVLMIILMAGWIWG